MAYRLQTDEKTAEGIRRIARAQIAKALRYLRNDTNRTLAILEARKALKRIRALLKLSRSGLGDKLYNRENTRFRDIARTLSQERDLAAMLQSIDWLRITNAEIALNKSTSAPGVAAAFDRIAGVLEKAGRRKKSDAARSDADHVEKAIAALTEVDALYAEIELPDLNISHLAAGLGRAYRSGRISYRIAYASHDVECFHEWRKDVQTHWRQLALLSSAWREEFEARIAATRELSQLIGTDHDLALLNDFSAACPKRKLPLRDKALIARCIEDSQAALRQEAYRLGALIYAEPPKSIEKRVIQYWRAALSEPSGFHPARSEVDTKTERPGRRPSLAT